VKNWRLREIASSCVVMGISLDDVAKDFNEGLGSIPRTKNSGIELRSKLSLRIGFSAQDTSAISR
jgi:hypothetical protein